MGNDIRNIARTKNSSKTAIVGNTTDSKKTVCRLRGIFETNTQYMNVFIAGAATTKFGELWATSPRNLAQEAVGNALKDAAIDIRRVQALFVGNMLSGMLGGQEHLGAFFAEELHLTAAAF